MYFDKYWCSEVGERSNNTNRVGYSINYKQQKLEISLLAHWHVHSVYVICLTAIGGRQTALSWYKPRVPFLSHGAEDVHLLKPNFHMSKPLLDWMTQRLLKLKTNTCLPDVSWTSPRLWVLSITAVTPPSAWLIIKTATIGLCHSLITNCTFTIVA